RLRRPSMEGRALSRTAFTCLEPYRHDHLCLFSPDPRECNIRGFFLSGGYPRDRHGGRVCRGYRILHFCNVVLQFLFLSTHWDTHHRRSAKLGGPLCLFGYSSYCQSTFRSIETTKKRGIGPPTGDGATICPQPRHFAHRYYATHREAD